MLTIVKHQEIIPPKSRAEWVKEIKAAHVNSVEAIIYLGRTLKAAKDALPHGQFLDMISRDLPFSKSVAQKLMKIAGDSRLTNAAHVRLLPTQWSKLYDLTKLPNDRLDQAFKDGTINPKMSRKDATNLLKRQGSSKKDDLDRGDYDFWEITNYHDHLEQLIDSLLGAKRKGEFKVNPNIKKSIATCIGDLQRSISKLRSLARAKRR